MWLVAHDWGAVALTLAGRIERLVAIDVLPLLPGHRWHWVARAWRTPGLGELAMGFTGRTLLRRLGGLSAAHADEVLRHFDHGTQRAILKLYRAEAAVTAPLDAVTAPALVVWGERDRYLDPAWAERVAGAFGGPAEVEIGPGSGALAVARPARARATDRPVPRDGEEAARLTGAPPKGVRRVARPRRTASSVPTRTDWLG